MNFVVFTLESQINTDYKWINVSNEVKHREYSREISDKSQCLMRNYKSTTIAEILLSEMNLYYRPRHVVVYINNDSVIFVLSLSKSLRNTSISNKNQS